MAQFLTIDLQDSTVGRSNLKSHYAFNLWVAWVSKFINWKDTGRNTLWNFNEKESQHRWSSSDSTILSLQIYRQESQHILLLLWQKRLQENVMLRNSCAIQNLLIKNHCLLIKVQAVIKSVKTWRWINDALVQKRVVILNLSNHGF